MTANQKPTELVMELLSTGETRKYEFENKNHARKFQQSMTMAITRMMTAKQYQDYWSYLELLRVMRDENVVYIGDPGKMPNPMGNVKVSVLD